MNRYACMFLAMGLICGSASAEGRFGIGIRGGLYLVPNWSDTYETIYDNSGELVLGLELAYRVTRNLEIAVAYDQISGDGDRVWPNESGGFEPSGESVSFDLNVISLVGRWMMMSERVLTPYFGLGVGYAQFEETEDDAESGIGFLIQAGLDWSITQHIHGLVEGEYSSYPDVIGEGDLSAYYGEDDVGGVIVRLGLRYFF
ncbi:outer membrane beta-barrel protein [bacterium]|nr:outer membrane beta-barrel protein [candidate division CSSED10-310 bacterium]